MVEAASRNGRGLYGITEMVRPEVEPAVRGEVLKRQNPGFAEPPSGVSRPGMTMAMVRGAGGRI